MKNKVETFIVLLAPFNRGAANPFTWSILAVHAPNFQQDNKPVFFLLIQSNYILPVSNRHKIRGHVSKKGTQDPSPVGPHWRHG